MSQPDFGAPGAVLAAGYGVLEPGASSQSDSETCPRGRRFRRCWNGCSSGSIELENYQQLLEQSASHLDPFAGELDQQLRDRDGNSADKFRTVGSHGQLRFPIAQCCSAARDAMDQLLSRGTVRGMRTDQSSGVGEKSPGHEQLH
ncbi:uncharacterized protein PFLUO_LOCUS4176 [Penicillium psychrofluorescens]|uniref:uncharacterized protein n=1 Tax=Penicillium psychrofluorescens TaxID=3158075 RepID=UPI003CCE0084